MSPRRTTHSKTSIAGDDGQDQALGNDPHGGKSRRCHRPKRRKCLRLGLADEVRYSIMPILIGDGVSFFDRLGKDVPLHLVEVKGYQSGMVALRYEVRR